MPVWAIATKPNVQNILGYGPEGGSGPFPGLGTGHDVTGVWLSE